MRTMTKLEVVTIYFTLTNTLADQDEKHDSQLPDFTVPCRPGQISIPKQPVALGWTDV